MSRGSRQAAPSAPRTAERPLLKSNSILAGGFRASGLCRTTNGWAVAVVEIDDEGRLVSVNLGDSQSFPDPVVARLVKQQMALNQETLRRHPWRPGG